MRDETYMHIQCSTRTSTPKILSSFLLVTKRVCKYDNLLVEVLFLSTSETVLFIGPACPVSDVQQLNNERGILERYSENYNYEVSSKTSTYFFFWSELQSLVEYFDTLQNERLTVRLNLTRKKSTPRKCL